MATENKQHNEEQENQLAPEEAVTDTPQGTHEGENGQDDQPEGAAPAGGDSKVQAELAEMKDKYLRLYSEFDNFRRRTAKEKSDLAKTATQDLMVALLPVVDDLERARQAMTDAQDVAAVKEGLELVFNKLGNTLQQKGLKPMQAIGQPFDADLHEAITQVPAPDQDQKGKVIDEVEKGYFLNEKVIRSAKVIIGA